MMWLTEPSLGRFDLGPPSPGGGCSVDGVVVTDFQVGSMNVREVIRDRALADGAVDDTAFVGARAISVSTVVQQGTGWPDPQLTIDRMLAYANPRLRPRLHWMVPGSSEVRSALVRGADAPVVVAQPRFHAVEMAWVAAQGVIESSDEVCTTIRPSDDVELGRTYDLTFDRVYPFSLSIGDRLLTNDGNTVANWRATIFGPCTDPSLTVNGTEMAFTNAGGIVLTGGTSLVIDSRERTILLNGDPTQSRYDKVNFAAWSWEDIRLTPGVNVVRFSAVVLDPAASTDLCFRSAYL